MQQGLRKQQGFHIAVLRDQTAPDLWHWLPDTADGGETFASHELPFHALIGAVQQVDGLQTAAVFRLHLNPCVAS